MSAADVRSGVASDISAIVSMIGEPASIGDWSGNAIIKGGPNYFTDVSGGGYQKDSLTLVIAKADLDTFVPAPQMDVAARGKTLRIPDDGITEYGSHYVINTASRAVPE